MKRECVLEWIGNNLYSINKLMIIMPKIKRLQLYLDEDVEDMTTTFDKLKEIVVQDCVCPDKDVVYFTLQTLFTCFHHCIHMYNV